MNVKVAIIFSLLLFVQHSSIRCEEDDEASIEVETDEGEKEDGEAGCGCAATSRQKDDSSESIADAPSPESNDDSKEKTKQTSDRKNVPASEAISNYPRTNQMVYIPQGSFIMGTKNPIIIPDGEGPQRKVQISGYWLDVHEVSNAEFEVFVNSTGYVTEVSHFILYF